MSDVDGSSPWEGYTPAQIRARYRAAGRAVDRMRARGSSLGGSIPRPQAAARIKWLRQKAREVEDFDSYGARHDIPHEIGYQRLHAERKGVTRRGQGGGGGEVHVRSYTRSRPSR